MKPMNSSRQRLFWLCSLVLAVVVGLVVSQPAEPKFAESGKSTSTVKKAEGDTNDVVVESCYRFTHSGEVYSLEFTAVVPKTIENNLVVTELLYSKTPDKVYARGENQYAKFIFKNPPRSMELRTKAAVKLVRRDLETLLAAFSGAGTAEPPALSDSQRSVYLGREKYLEIDDPAIKEAAAGIRPPDSGDVEGKGGDADKNLTSKQVALAKEIYTFVRKKMNYGGYDPQPLGAVRSLRQGKGDCTDFSDLFIALCRAKDLPARPAKGLVSEYTNVPKHDWAEVYIHGLGWVPFDLTVGDKNGPSPTKLRPIRIRLSVVRNDREINDFSLFAYTATGPGAASVKMTDWYEFYNEPSDKPGAK